MLVHNKAENIKFPDGLMITDPPYNQNYKYNSYKDKLKESEYLKLLSVIKPPCVIIHYPEETINLLPKIFGRVDQVVSWVYNSNTAKQSRLISWWGCKPDFRKVTQPYKNPNDKRIQAYMKLTGKTGAKIYDWWEYQQVKNVSKEKTAHPCQIPEKIIENIILTTANKDTTILDPFVGSGTTLVVAKKLGYNYFGTEMDELYYNIAEKRLNQCS